MFFEKIRELRGTLALRLTLWYAAIFAVTCAIGFSVVFWVIVAIVKDRTDEDLLDDIKDFANLMHSGGLQRVESEMASEALGEEASETFLRLWASDGREVLATDLSDWEGLNGYRIDLTQALEAPEPILDTLSLPHREYALRRATGAIAPGLVLEIGESLEDDEEFLAGLFKGLLITLLGVLSLSAPIGWFLARRALQGVNDLTNTAAEIAGGALDRRVAVGNGRDELDRLARTFNLMLDRIQALIVGMREMTDNLAHDLRSPIARLRTSAEMTLPNGKPDKNWEAVAANTTEECDRLLEIINTTLDIAEAESGAAALNLEDLDLVALVEGALEVFQTVAEDKHIRVTTDLPAGCRVRGDRQKLQRVVANLLDNALKYTLPSGLVEVSMADEGSRVRLSIRDSGVGIATEDLPRIFRRFYRCDQSRSEQGNGLGLSLTQAFMRAHGGDVSVTSTPGVGSTFSATLDRGDRGKTSGSVHYPMPGQLAQRADTSSGPGVG